MDTTQLQFLDRKEQSVAIVKGNFPPWSGATLVIELVRTRSDGVRAPADAHTSARMFAFEFHAKLSTEETVCVLKAQ